MGVQPLASSDSASEFITAVSLESPRQGRSASASETSILRFDLLGQAFVLEISYETAVVSAPRTDERSRT